MSRTIEDLAQKAQDEQELRQQKQRDEQSSTDTNKGYTEISSFLTQRPRDPDGQPRRAGQTQPRSLAEILGKEDIFLLLHHHFVQLLRCLGDKFGGLPLAQRKDSLQTGTSPQLQMTSPNKRGRIDLRMPAILA
ncbi:hypothetical protein LTS08_001631 [Lithohypha guttulata]|uniref:Folliculin/SMCR8 longin domain-containing protein n=1 Tax=Lithohypha guttulata TaxID=1690604 RepID=A0AAN7SUV3_9EURO|nr:hypothetical protein LTR51_003685 [Lithohypha guttulata]KAK5082191.1 hypothetical protein LTR05_007334 [Lithohypha guttulata]KAK5105354.1 hypothetical protein LTS08_001631 [Lithohypha guttulata]